ncbi:hypothetical protein [Mesorhizobium caraganae]|uniref:hypothetical protein n=1 Tax=Mesorhizobium caraganae TaxID=483206 RepID=UPI003ECD7E52
MRAAKRGSQSPPGALSKRGKDKLTELERARNHMQAPLAAATARKAFDFSVYKADEVKKRLEALFHGKCAYCESLYASQAPVDVEHYRPKAAVDGDPNHPGYWWLAMEWTNLLPSCIDCNRRRKQKTPEALNDVALLYRTMLTGKMDCFPVQGTRVSVEAGNIDFEEPLLLDPTRDDPERHLQFVLAEGTASGLVVPKSLANQPVALPDAVPDAAAVAAHADGAGLSVRGAVSIQVYGLNRLRLVQERAQLLQRMRFYEYLIVRLGSVLQSLSRPHLDGHAEVVDAIRNLVQLQDRVTRELIALAAPEAPFSALAASFIKDLKHRMALPPP